MLAPNVKVVMRDCEALRCKVGFLQNYATTDAYFIQVSM